MFVMYLSVHYVTVICSFLYLVRSHCSYSRDWRYHKEQRLWITRAPGMKPNKQEATYEEGTYCYFDMQSWRKTHKEFHVEYDKLEDRPQMPQHGVSLQAPGMN